MLVGFLCSTVRQTRKVEERETICVQVLDIAWRFCVSVDYLTPPSGRTVSAWRMEISCLSEQVCMTFNSVVCSKMASFCYATPFLNVSFIRLAV